MNSFTYQYPVKNYFGEGAVSRALDSELPRMGDVVMLAFGGGSVKASGLYDEVAGRLAAAGKEVVPFGGIMPNPTYAKVQEGAALAREKGVDFILALGGGSVFDCCKIVSAQATLEDDIWTFEREQGGSPTAFIPLGCIVTLTGTGAEQNNGGVITNEELQVKGPLTGALPVWAAIDPKICLAAPHSLVMGGAFDTFSHCMETYFGTPRSGCASDDMNLAIQRNIVRNMRVLAANPVSLDAMSELAYASVMGENGVLKIGKVGDFQCHMIQHQYAAITHTNHAQGLAAIHPSLYRALAPHALEQFARWAREVWGVEGDGDDPLAVALAGIDALESFIREMDLPTRLSELGADVSDEVFEAVAKTAVRTPGCAKALADEEIVDILKAAR